MWYVLVKSNATSNKQKNLKTNSMEELMIKKQITELVCPLSTSPGKQNDENAAISQCINAVQELTQLLVKKQESYDKMANLYMEECKHSRSLQKQLDDLKDKEKERNTLCPPPKSAPSTKPQQIVVDTPKSKSITNAIKEIRREKHENYLTMTKVDTDSNMNQINNTSLLSHTNKENTTV